MGRLDGKVAAVTGGASGIGEAAVRRFVAEGASVAFCDRDGERGQRVAAELETAGAKVAFTQADVGTEAACLAFVNAAAQKFDRLDILINNAGIRKYEKIDEASAASWNEILSVNLMSYVFCAKAAVPLMRRSKGGAIVNIASVRSVVAGGGNLQYDTTKAAVAGLTRALAADHSPEGIRVNAVGPGPIFTPFHCVAKSRVHDTSYPSGGHGLVGPAWVSDLDRLRKLRASTFATFDRLTCSDLVRTSPFPGRGQEGLELGAISPWRVAQRTSAVHPEASISRGLWRTVRSRPRPVHHRPAGLQGPVERRRLPPGEVGPALCAAIATLPRGAAREAVDSLEAALADAPHIGGSHARSARCSRIRSSSPRSGQDSEPRLRRCCAHASRGVHRPATTAG